VNCLAVMSLLASCSIYDPSYAALLPIAETAPQKDAIVGMWHRKGGDGMGRHETYSLLFDRAGKGHYNSLITDLLLHNDVTGRFDWAYEGAGIWKTTLTPGEKVDGFGYFLKVPTSWRLAGGKLLQQSDASTGSFFYVWERVSQ
jgi:hypothetical protein